MYALKPKLHERQRQYVPGTLRTVALDVTPKCNMKCSHCYAEPFMARKPLELKYFQNAIDEFYELGVHAFVLQGGEPIIDHSRLATVLDMLRLDETYINVVSNGWSMDLAMIKWLKERQVDKIAFSLDSGLPEEHDRNRALHSYERVMQAIDYVLNEGLLTSISTMVTHTSLYSTGFNEALKFAKNKGIRMDIQIVMPVGKLESEYDLLLTENDVAYIRRLREETGRLPSGQMILNRDIFNYGGGEHCPAGTEFMSLTCDGNLFPCNFMQFTLGNIQDRSVKQMRKDLLQCNWFDGNRTSCLIGEDREFIGKFLAPNVDEVKPLDAYRIFNLAINK